MVPGKSLSLSTSINSVLEKNQIYFAIVFSTPENLLVGISGGLGMKESHFLS